MHDRSTDVGTSTFSTSIVMHFCVTPLVSATVDRAGKPESPA